MHIPTSNPIFSEGPVHRRFQHRLEPGVRGGRQMLVHLNAGAAAGVARALRGLSKRSDLARYSRRSNTSELVVSAGPVQCRDSRSAKACSNPAGSPIDVGALLEDSLGERCLGAVVVVSFSDADES